MSLCSYEILLLNSHTSEMTDHSTWETITLRTSIHYQSETLAIYLIWFLSFSTLSATEVTRGWIQPSVRSSEKKATKVAYALPCQLSHGDNGMWHCPASCHMKTMACDIEQCFCSILFCFLQISLYVTIYMRFFGLLRSDLILIVLSSPAFCYEFNKHLESFLKMICLKWPNHINHLCVVFTFLDLYASYLFICHLVCSESGECLPCGGIGSFHGPMKANKRYGPLSHIYITD